jgi:hypothetical protein
METIVSHHLPLLIVNMRQAAYSPFFMPAVIHCTATYGTWCSPGDREVDEDRGRADCSRASFLHEQTQIQVDTWAVKNLGVDVDFDIPILFRPLSANGQTIQ